MQSFRSSRSCSRCLRPRCRLRSSPAFAKGGAGSAGPGIASSVFCADGELAFPRAKLLGERLPLHGTRVAMPGAFLSGPRPAQPGSGAGASWSRRNTAVAILASAILPGMGELYCYRTSRDPWTLARVPVFLAVEGYLWYSYVDNQEYRQGFQAGVRGVRRRALEPGQIPSQSSVLRWRHRQLRQLGGLQ